jgi:sphingomyelin phosphodiesterase 2
MSNEKDIERNEDNLEMGINYPVTSLPRTMPEEIKVASFNVWGLYISKDRKTRMKAIAAHLRTTDYAIIGLQEVWVRKDYEYLAKELSMTFPYSYYFKSGQMGSGMATFSKYPIKQAIFHRFLLNGQAHHIWHGDWWSGKGVGLTRIQISDDFSVNFYNTHLHAEYNKKSEEYLGHRLSQMQQLFQFVQMSSAVPETEHFMNIIAGDLNTYPGCFTFDLFLKQDIVRSNMNDSAVAFATKNKLELEKIGNTFNVSGNSYSKDKKPEQRIDYILFSGSENFGVKNYSVLKEDKLAKEGKVSLSDHCLLEVTFQLKGKFEAAEKAEASMEEQCNLIKKSIAVLSKDIHYTKKSQTRHIVLSIIQLILFLGITIGVSLVLTFDTLPLIVTLLAFVLAPGFLIGSILSGLIAIVWLPDELAHLHGFASQWNLALLARGVETLPISGIVDAMDSNPEAIEQMCTVTGNTYDKNLIKKILNQKRKSLTATPVGLKKPPLVEIDEILMIKEKNKTEFEAIQIEPTSNFSNLKA